MEQETERFLTQFKELENKLVDISGLEDSYVSFSRALDKVHAERRNPLIGNNNVYNFLKTASDLRNIFSHENDVCTPTKEFVDKFVFISQEILNPITAYNICTKADKIVYATPNSLLKEVVDEMVEYKISHVPIIKSGKVIGVFSSTSFFQYYYLNKKLSINDEFSISDFMNVLSINGHINESFMFISKQSKAYSLLNYFAKNKPGEKRVSCLFVTEHGKGDEALLGIVTEADLLNIPLYERKMLKGS